MSRARSTARYTSAPPGRAIATTVDGQTLRSDYIASPYWRVVEVGTDGSGRVKVKTQKKHGLQTGALVETCLGGWHGVTERAHPGNVTNTAVERIDDYWLSLTGTTAEATSTFLHGQMWVTGTNTTGYTAVLNAFSALVQEAGGGVIEFPGVYIALESNLLFRENVFFVGKGKGVTRFVALDSHTSHVLQNAGESNCGGRSFTICGHRQRRDPNRGMHNLRAGATGVITDNFIIYDVGSEGSAGYGTGWQAGAFTNCRIEMDSSESDSDGFDNKNHLSLNYGNFISMRVKHFGLFRVGMNAPGEELSTDPFTMTSGSSIVTVSHPGHPWVVGSKVTFEAGTVRGIDMGGTFTIQSKVSNGYTVDASPQTASSPGTGGGTGVLEYASGISDGDSGVDLRGEGWTIGPISVEGALWSRTGFRMRLGDASSPNGTGAIFSGAGSIIVKNTSSNKTNAQGVNIAGRGNNFPSVVVQGAAQGVSFSTNARGNSVGLVNAYDCTTAVVMRGDDNSTGTVVADTCGTGWAAIGGQALDRTHFSEDPFTSTAGSNVVTAYAPGHGKTTGALVTITFARPGNDVDPNVTDAAITVIDANNFTFVASSTATASGAFGGENAIYSFGVVQVGNNLSCGILKTRGCTVGAHIYEGTVKTQITDRSSTGDTIDLIDAGSGTILYPVSTIHADVHKWASTVIQSTGATTTAEMTRLDTFVDAEVADGTYALTHDYNLWGAVSDSIASRVSLKKRLLATATATAVHLPLQGWQGNAVDAALNTKFIPSVHATDMANGRGRPFAFVLNNVSGAKTIMGVQSGTSSPIRLRTRTAGDAVSGQMMSAAGTFAEPVTDSKYYTAIQRDGTADLQADKDGTEFVDITVGSLSLLPPDKAVYVLGFNNGDTLQEPSDAIVFATGMAEPFSTLALKQAQAANLLALAQAAGAVP